MATEALVMLHMKADGTTEIVRSAKVFDQAKTSAGGLGLAVSGLGKVWGSTVGLIRAHPIASAIAGFLTVRAIKDFTTSSVAEFVKEEQALKRVESAVVSQGGSWELYGDIIKRVTGDLQRKTTFADDDQLEAVSELTTVLGDAQKALDVLPIVLDVAARHGLDLASASRAIGLALQGDTGLIGRYVPALRGLKDEQKDTATIMKILEERYKGQAETLAQSLSGVILQAKNAWSDLKEAIGKPVLEFAEPFLREWKEGFERVKDIIESEKKPMGEKMREIAGVTFAILGDQIGVSIELLGPVVRKGGEFLGHKLVAGINRTLGGAIARHPLILTALGGLAGGAVGARVGGPVGALIGGVAGGTAALGGGFVVAKDLLSQSQTSELVASKALQDLRSFIPKPTGLLRQEVVEGKKPQPFKPFKGGRSEFLFGQEFLSVGPGEVATVRETNQGPEVIYYMGQKLDELIRLIKEQNTKLSGREAHYITP